MDIINEMWRLLRTRELNIVKHVVWQDERDWQLAHLKLLGYAVSLGEHGYYFTDERRDEEGMSA